MPGQLQQEANVESIRNSILQELRAPVAVEEDPIDYSSLLLSPDKAREMEDYVSGGVEGVYNKKIQDLFSGKGKKGTLKKILLGMVEGVTAFTGNPTLTQHLAQGATTEYRTKAPYLDRELRASNAASLKVKQEDQRTRRKLQELAIKYKDNPQVQANVLKLLAQERLTVAQADNAFANVELTTAKTRGQDLANDAAQARSGNAALGGLPSSIVEGILAKLGTKVGDKTLSGEEITQGMAQAGLAKGASSLFKQGQGTQSTTRGERLITKHLEGGKSDLVAVPYSNTTGRAGNPNALATLNRLLGIERPTEEDTRSYEKKLAASKANVPSEQQPVARAMGIRPTPPLVTPRGERPVLDSYFSTAKGAETHAASLRKLENMTTTSAEVFSAINDEVTRFGPVKGSGYAQTFRNWLNAVPTGEVASRGIMVANLMRELREQSGLAVNQGEIKRMEEYMPTSTDRNKTVIEKQLTISLMAVAARMKMQLPAAEREKLAQSTDAVILPRVRGLMKQIEAGASPKDVIPRNLFNPGYLFPDLVRRGVISGDGAITQTEKDDERVRNAYGAKNYKKKRE